MPDKRERILIATEQLIARCGLEHTSMNGVAQHAGVAAGTIYRYFKDKDDLLFQLYVRLSRLAAESFFIGVDGSASLFDRFQQIWLNIYDYHTRFPERLRVKEQLDAAPRSEQAQLISQQVFFPLLEFARQGIAEGVFKPLSPDLLFTLAFGPTLLIGRMKACQSRTLESNEKYRLIRACWDAILIHQDHPFSTTMPFDEE